MDFVASAPARPDAVVQGDRYRISVLTSRLIRIEYSESGQFEDRPTQAVVCRDFPVPAFSVRDDGETLTVETDDISLVYDKRPFSAEGLSFRLGGGLTTFLNTWRYGEPTDDLRGTMRTLDQCNGAVPLDAGVLSRRGFAVYDDSHTMAIDESGWVAPRSGANDLYFFGYGHDYRGCLRDFYRLCGKTPLLPRYALGNWWSRYYRYTQEEYLALIERFEQEKIPLAVSVIDMDWHLVDIDKKYGSGWTGYTWNEELFPDHRALLDTLHDKGLHVTLNVHPADGIRGHEAVYPAVARALGYDAESEERVPFDATSPAFFDAYFQLVHHPLEAEGVDFWWIDWQQGNTTRIPGLDPLWMLNHYHYLDNCRDGKRGMILSRYAGVGSHRYPLGFSGDATISWKMLAFEPYFTANASNIGYGWWSHDIGGHMGGIKDDELAVRWLQFGVFSPICRLHSSCSPFNSKEPWRYGDTARRQMTRQLRLRHELLPYLYTMMARNHFEDAPLIQPMYYSHAEESDSYGVPNQYWFGSEMFVCPIVSPIDAQSRVAAVEAWLPDGQWFDLFDDRVYRGGRRLTLHRSTDAIPVLVKAGGIVPLAKLQDGNNIANPEILSVHIFPAADGAFTLYEDDDASAPHSATTAMRLDWEARTFTVCAAAGDRTVLPARRRYEFCFHDFDRAPESVTVDGNTVAFNATVQGRRWIVTVPQADAAHTVVVHFPADTAVSRNDPRAEAFALLDRAQIPFDTKDAIWRQIGLHGDRPADLLAAFCFDKTDPAIVAPLTEYFIAE